MLFEGWEDYRLMKIQFFGQNITIPPRSLAHAEFVKMPYMIGEDTFLEVRLVPLEYLHLCYAGDGKDKEGCEDSKLHFTFTMEPKLVGRTPAMICSDRSPPMIPPPPRPRPPPSSPPPCAPPIRPPPPKPPPPPPSPSPPPPKYFWPGPPPNPPPPPYPLPPPPSPERAFLRDIHTFEREVERAMFSNRLNDQLLLAGPALVAMVMCWYCMGCMMLKQRLLKAAANEQIKVLALEEARNLQCDEQEEQDEEALLKKMQKGRRAWAVELELGEEEIDLVVDKHKIDDIDALKRAVVDACVAKRGDSGTPRRWRKGREAGMEIQYELLGGVRHHSPAKRDRGQPH